MSDVLIFFLHESLMIEGIHRDPTGAEIGATKRFLDGDLSTESVVALQAVYAPGKPLRDQPGMNVSVGGYIAPQGNRHMRDHLHRVLGDRNPWHLHVAFELLHPFMDGNGRTGRTIWAWAMIRNGEDPFGLGFLHRFYYQTLANAQ